MDMPRALLFLLLMLEHYWNLWQGVSSHGCHRHYHGGSWLPLGRGAQGSSWPSNAALWRTVWKPCLVRKGFDVGWCHPHEPQAFLFLVLILLHLAELVIQVIQQIIKYLLPARHCSILGTDTCSGQNKYPYPCEIYSLMAWTNCKQST